MRGVLAGRDPMDGGEELDAEGGLEAFDELGDAVEAGAGLGAGGEELLGFGDGSREERELLVRGVAAVGVACDEVTRSTTWRRFSA